MGDGLERGLFAARTPVPNADGTRRAPAPGVIVLLSDGKNTLGRRDPLEVARRPAAQHPDLRDRARHARRRGRAARLRSASCSASRSRRTRRRCKEIARVSRRQVLHGHRDRQGRGDLRQPRHAAVLQGREARGHGGVRRRRDRAAARGRRALAGLVRPPRLGAALHQRRSRPPRRRPRRPLPRRARSERARSRRGSARAPWGRARTCRPPPRRRGPRASAERDALGRGVAAGAQVARDRARLGRRARDRGGRRAGASMPGIGGHDRAVVDEPQRRRGRRRRAGRRPRRRRPCRGTGARRRGRRCHGVVVLEPPAKRSSSSARRAARPRSRRRSSRPSRGTTSPVSQCCSPSSVSAPSSKNVGASRASAAIAETSRRGRVHHDLHAGPLAGFERPRAERENRRPRRAGSDASRPSSVPSRST